MQSPDRFMMARPSSKGAKPTTASQRRHGRPKSRPPSVRDRLRGLREGRAAETPAALREADPGVLLGGPGDRRRRREGFVGKAPDRDRDVVRQGARGPKHRRPAFRAEARLETELARGTLEAPRCALDADGRGGEIGRHAENAAGPALALPAVAGKDALRLALDRDPKLPAGAGGGACHRRPRGPAERAG